MEWQKKLRSRSTRVERSGENGCRNLSPGSIGNRQFVNNSLNLIDPTGFCPLGGGVVNSGYSGGAISVDSYDDGKSCQNAEDSSGGDNWDFAFLLIRGPGRGVTTLAEVDDLRGRFDPRPRAPLAATAAPTSVPTPAPTQGPTQPASAPAPPSITGTPAPPAIGPPASPSTRPPDFYNVQLSIGPDVGPAVSVSVDKNGNVYVGFGLQAGKSPFFLGVSATANTLNRPADLNGMLTGLSVSGGAGTGLGAQETWTPGTGEATGVGFFTPQGGGSVTWSIKLGNIW